MKTVTNITYSAIGVVAVACLALLPLAQAVVPAPDGGYPNFTTAEGTKALQSLTTGSANTAVGWFSLFSNTDGSFNTAIGAGTLLANTGDQNTAYTGAAALFSNSTGSFNTANGSLALFSNTMGANNTATGDSALYFNTIGLNNTANGEQTLYRNTTGNDNTAIGAGALSSNTIGGNNTAIGTGALASNTTGTQNTVLGAGAGFDVTTANNVICIGAQGNNVSDSCYIGNIFNATSSGGIAVFINSNGRLGTTTSSRRFKDDIKLMDQASEALFKLKPVTFRYKKEIDPARTSQFGLVAEEVEKVNPDLIVRDKEGKPYSVRYDQVNAMLLNEFLKEHRKVARLEATVAQQHKDLEAAVAELKGQIQRVSAQLAAASPSRGGLEASKSPSHLRRKWSAIPKRGISTISRDAFGVCLCCTIIL